MSTIVETVTGDTLAGLREARDRATAGMVELRLDGVRDLDVAGALADRRVPVVVTCRPTWEGGRFDGSESDRLAILAAAIDLGAEYIDLEWRADRRALPRSERTRVVLSNHDFDGVPADIRDRTRAMLGEGADIVKIAVRADRLSDCLTLREVLAIDTPHIAIAMGSAGHLTRLCPWLFGSCWTYGGAAAPGQVGVRDMQRLYRVEAGSAATALYGIAGQPLGHSASPAMHNAAFAQLGLDAMYVTFETADADELINVADAFGVSGASITAPLKPAVFTRVRHVDALAEDTGAVNTIRRGRGGWEGRNFDVAGFLAPLEQRGRALAGTLAVVLGAGGSARTAI
ncbi:MAG: type I 3-dehydroquinate dehydratase, partial [Vicinamibacterales bacterium]